MDRAISVLAGGGWRSGGKRKERMKDEETGVVEGDE